MASIEEGKAELIGYREDGTSKVIIAADERICRLKKETARTGEFKRFRLRTAHGFENL